MPDALANINAAASLLTGSDPICGTCDIQATVRATRRVNIGPSLEASRCKFAIQILIAHPARVQFHWAMKPLARRRCRIFSCDRDRM